MEKKITITYRWWESNPVGQTNIKASHIKALEESAMQRIAEKMNDGIVSGELQDIVRMDETDGEDGTEYSGWFEIDTQTI